MGVNINSSKHSPLATYKLTPPQPLHVTITTLGQSILLTTIISFNFELALPSVVTLHQQTAFLRTGFKITTCVMRFHFRSSITQRHAPARPRANQRASSTRNNFGMVPLVIRREELHLDTHLSLLCRTFNDFHSMLQGFRKLWAPRSRCAYSFLT